MSLDSLFKTDPVVEAKGIEVQYNEQIFVLARSGGSNTEYKKELTKTLKPLRRAIDTDLITDDQLLPKLIEVFAKKAVVAAYIESVDAEGNVARTPGIQRKDGVLPFTVENLVKTFKELPELYRDLQAKSSSAKLYLEDLEAAAKN